VDQSVVGMCEVRGVEVRAPDIGTCQIAFSEDRLAECRPAQIRAREAAAANPTTRKIITPQICTTKLQIREYDALFLLHEPFLAKIAPLLLPGGTTHIKRYAQSVLTLLLPAHITLSPCDFRVPPAGPIGAACHFAGFSFCFI
jgi:hypothetical protein